jgi:DNA repair photolyase
LPTPASADGPERQVTRQPPGPRGRGTAENPENRYERIHYEPDPPEDIGHLDSDADISAAVGPDTKIFRDTSRTILAENESPDVGFRWSLNPYRGCEHGCTYCYARPSHQYLGFSAGLDFESRLLVKEDAPELLRQTLLASSWQPDVIALSGNTDCYQPIERKLGITRRCLEVLAEFLNPVGVVTKSALVTRDADLLAQLARNEAAHVIVSITTLDRDLAGRLEPRAAAPERRVEAIQRLTDAGVPTGVLVAPVIPGLNDSEIPRILERAAAAGARSASWVLLRLAPPLDTLFTGWLERHFPDRVTRVLNRIRQCRGGKLSDSRFGHRMRGEGTYAEQVDRLFRIAARHAGLDHPLPPLSTQHFVRPPHSGEQLRLY